MVYKYFAMNFYEYLRINRRGGVIIFVLFISDFLNQNW